MKKRNISDVPDYELSSKFRSKADFYDALTNNCK